MSRPLYVVDAGALLAAWLPDEPRKAQALLLLDDLVEKRVELCSTALLHAEILNGLYRRVIGKAGSKITAQEAFESWRAFEGLKISIRSTDQLGTRILELAIQYAWPATYDMLYLALAEQLGMPLITTDEKLADVVGPDRVLPLQEYRPSRA